MLSPRIVSGEISLLGRGLADCRQTSPRERTRRLAASGPARSCPPQRRTKYHPPVAEEGGVAFFSSAGEEAEAEVSAAPVRFFCAPYSVAYQPPPFRANEVLDIRRFAGPLQMGQERILFPSSTCLHHSSKT